MQPNQLTVRYPLQNFSPLFQITDRTPITITILMLIVKQNGLAAGSGNRPLWYGMDAD